MPSFLRKRVAEIKRRWFNEPLQSFDDVLHMFNDQLEEDNVDLTLLSLVLGFFEHHLTSAPSSSLSNSPEVGSHSPATPTPALTLPPLDWPTLEPLYLFFHSLIKGSIDLSLEELEEDHELVSRVAQIIWNNLSSSPSSGPHLSSSTATGSSSFGCTSSSSASYKDKAHLQFIYSFLVDHKLDPFGVSFTTLAALQVLFPTTFSTKYFLTLSEDHSWISLLKPGPGPATGSGQEADSGGKETQKKTGFKRVEVTWHGKEDKRRSGVRGEDTPDNWLYLKGHPVICHTTGMTVATLISSINPSINLMLESETLSLLQKELLWLCYDKGFLANYPMGLGNLADLEELLPSSSPTEGQTSLEQKKSKRKHPYALYTEAVAAARSSYGNAHVYPYSYLSGYCFRFGLFAEALNGWKEAARVISGYNYNPRDDEEIYREMQEIATDLIPFTLKQLHQQVALRQDREQEQRAFRDVVEFFDGLCKWEEGSLFPVLHIGWAKSFMSCLNKFPFKARREVEIRGETEDPEEGRADAEGDESADQRDEDAAEKGSQRKRIKVDPLDVKPATETMEKEKEEEMKTDLPEKLTAEKRDAKEPTDGVVNPLVVELVSKCGDNLLNPDYLLGNSDQPLLSSSKAALLPSGEETGGAEGEGDGNEDSGRMKGPRNEKEKEIKAILLSKKMMGLKELLGQEKVNGSAIQLQLTAQSQISSSLRRGGERHSTQYRPFKDRKIKRVSNK